MPIPVDLLKNDDKVWFCSSETSSVVSKTDDTCMCREMNLKNRTDKRFVVEDNHYIIIESYAPQICSLLNIGSGGLSYTYFKEDERETETSGTFDILVKGSGFCVEKIPYKIMKDTPAPDNTGAGGMEKRVVNIRFENLTEKQKNIINNYILNFIDKSLN